MIQPIKAIFIGDCLMIMALCIFQMDHFFMGILFKAKLKEMGSMFIVMGHYMRVDLVIRCLMDMEYWNMCNSKLCLMVEE